MNSYNHLEITTKIGCSVACSFCPQIKLVTKYNNKEKLMSIDNFIKIISTIPTNVDIHFSGYAEPFLNLDAPKMIEIARKKGHKVVIYSTFVGLNEEGVNVLKNVRPDWITVHVTDGKAMKIPDERWINFHDLFLKTGLKANQYMAMGNVTEKIKNYLNSHNISYEKPQMLSRAGNLPHIKGQALKGNIKCWMNRWHQNVVLPNGDVYVCCMDYSLTMPLGNLINQNYNHIYKEAEKYKSNSNPPEDSICRYCEWAANI